MTGNILIVDDSPASLALLRDILAQEGHQVRPFNNGELAIRSAHAQPPDLILLDIRMPDMDGFEVCRQLKADPRLQDIPVIFISAAPELEDKVRAFAAGGVDYIAKPFHYAEVLARVRTHVALHQSRVQLKQLNETLEQRVAEQVARNREQDLMLNQQARMAALGQMIHNIAHQWKQPLNALSLVLGNIKDDYQYQELNLESLESSLQKAHSLLAQMSTTVDDFQNFCRPDQHACLFDLDLAIEQALAIMQASLRHHQIRLKADLQKGLRAFGFPTQFAHAVLNLVANAKEAIASSGRKEGQIAVTLREDAGRGVLNIEDDAGGIPEQILPTIFDPYVTTKAQGSGIGLYLTRLIVERKHGGNIEARNTANGAVFTVSVPLSAKPPEEA